MPPAPGTRLRDLVLLEPLGRGAQGAVWRARSESTGAVVALKVMRLGGGRESERARREARALSQLAHPSLPRCMRTLEDEDNGWLGLELELVDGSDLGKVTADLDPHARRKALRHVAAALQHLHGAGVVHRDVKPANVVVARDFAAHTGDPTRCKLVDLGIAVTTGNPSPLTRTGHPGTVAFMPPEALDPVAFPAAQGRPTLDVFAFGVTGWVLLRGKHPTGLPLDADGEDFVHAYTDHAEAAHLFLPPEDVVDPFERVLAACLRLRPEARPQDGAALVALLDDALAARAGGGGAGGPGAGQTRTREPRAVAVQGGTVPRALGAQGAGAPGAVTQGAQPHGAQPQGALPQGALPQATMLAAQPPRNVPGPTVNDAAVARSLSGARGPGKRALKPHQLALIAMAGLAAVAALALGALSRRSALLADLVGRGDTATAAPTSGLPAAPPAVATSAGRTAPAAPPRPVVTPASSEPPAHWDAVGESNVRYSSALGCETKVLQGWFRVRCVRAAGEMLTVTARPDVGVRVEQEARHTTVLVPLRGPDVTLTFDWVGGRGVRTLRVDGAAADHRTVRLQGEFSAP